MVRMGTMKIGKLGPGPGLKKLTRQVAETGATMESILMDTIHRLYARAVTLATAAVNEGENQERKGFLTDLIDSIHEKTTRFLLMRERMRKKIKKLNIEHYTRDAATGYSQKETILLYGKTQRLQIYSVKYGQIFRPEYAAYTSSEYQRLGAASLCENGDKSTST